MARMSLLVTVSFGGTLVSAVRAPVVAGQSWKSEQPARIANVLTLSGSPSTAMVAAS